MPNTTHHFIMFFFFQAEDGIRDLTVTGVQTCALPIYRNLDTPALAGMPAAAYAGGVDLFHRWHHNTYAVAASLGASYLRGDTLALQDVQQSSSRYYQRPDAASFPYDPRPPSLPAVTGAAFA